MERLPFESGALLETGSGVAVLHDQLMGNNQMVLVVEFVRNIGNNRPDLIELENAAQRTIRGIDEWRLATAAEVLQSVEKRREVLNAKLDAIVERALLAMDK